MADAIFRAVGDFSRLRREARRTAKELRDTGDEGREIGPKVEQGLDKGERAAGRFNKTLEGLRKRVNSLPRDVDIQVEADVRDALRNIDKVQKALGRLDDTSVDVDADTANAARALAQLDRQIRGVERRVGVSVDTDTRGSVAQLARFNREAKESRARSGELRGSLVQLAGGFGLAAGAMHLLRLPAFLAGISAAIGVVGALTAGVVALASALGPVVGLLPALASGAGALAQGLGVVAGSFFGISDALKAFVQDEQAAAKAASQGGAAATAAARQRRDAAEAIEDAARGVQEAEEEAAKGVARAQRNVEDAYRDRARALESAAERIVEAEETLVDAQRSARRAQEDLNEARQQAARDLEDLRAAVSGMALDEESAVLRVEEARHRLSEVMRRQTDDADDYADKQLDIRRAQLSVREAELDLQETRRDRSRQEEELREAEAKGIEGADRVVAAQENVRTAEEGVADASQELSRAHRDMADTQEETARRIADAEAALAEAHEDGARRIADAQEQLARATERAAEIQEEAAGSTSKFSEAMQGQSPIAHALVATLLSFRAPLRDLQRLGQEAMFPGLIRALEILRPLLDTIEPLVSATAGVIGAFAVRAAQLAMSPMFQQRFLSILGTNVTFLDLLGRAAIPLADGLIRILAAAQPLVYWIGQLALRWAESFQSAVEGAERSGALPAFFERTRDVVERLISILKNLVGVLLGVGKASADAGRWILESLDRALERLDAFVNSPAGQTRIAEFFESLKPLLSEIGKLVGAVFRTFARVVQAVAPHLAPVVAALREKLLPALEQLFTTALSDPTFLLALVDLATAVLRLMTVFSTATPLLVAFVRGLTWLLEKAVELQEKLGPVGDQIVNIVTALSAGGLIAGIVALVAALGRLLISLSGIGAILGFLASPIGLVVVAIAGLVAGFILAYQRSEQFRAGVQKVVDWFQREAAPRLRAFAKWVIGAFQDAVVWVETNWPRIQEAVGHVINFILSLWDRFGSAILGKVSTIFGFIQEIIKAGMQFIQGIIELVLALINGEWGRAWDAIKMILGAVWDAMFALVRLVWNSIFDFLKIGLAALRLVWDTIWNVMSSVLGAIWDTMKSIVSTAFEWVKSTIEGILGGIQSAWESTWNFLKDVLGGIWDGIKAAVRAGVNGLIAILNTLIDGANFILRVLPGDIQIPKIPEVGGDVGGGGGTGWITANRFQEGGEIGESRRPRRARGKVGGTGSGDKVPLWAEPGEYMIRKSIVRKHGVGTFQRINSGGPLQLSLGGFVRGIGEAITGNPVAEFVGNVVGGAIDVASDVAKAGARTVFKPVKAMAERALDSIPGQETFPVRIMVGIARKLLNAVEALIHEKDDERLRAGTGSGYGWQALVEWLKMGNIPHTVTSTVRPGAITKSGNRSRHADGLAVDVVGPSMPRIFDRFMEVQSALAELIHSPMGYSIKSGARVAPYAVPDHYDHVHAATYSGPGEGPGLPIGGPAGSAGAGGGDAVAIGREMAAARGWTGAEWDALYELWRRESNWNPNATNPSSGAYGIPQALPGAHGRPFNLGDARAQIEWGLNYIAERYGSPSRALAFHDRNNWYRLGGSIRTFDRGGVLDPGVNVIANRTGSPEPVLPATELSRVLKGFLDDMTEELVWALGHRSWAGGRAEPGGAGSAPGYRPMAWSPAPRGTTHRSWAGGRAEPAGSQPTWTAERLAHRSWAGGRSEPGLGMFSAQESALVPAGRAVTDVGEGALSQMVSSGPTVVVEVEPGNVDLYLGPEKVASAVVPFIPKKLESRRRGRPL